MYNKTIYITVGLCLFLIAGITVAYIVCKSKQNGATVTPKIEIGNLSLEEFNEEGIDDFVIIDGHIYAKDDLPKE